MTSAVLQLEAVSARHGRGAPLALQGVSFSIAAGEAWVVLGPNGAGKSTLVRAVMGLVPTDGAVRLLGDAVAQLPSAELARRVAWVPQTIDEASGFTALEVALMGRAPWQQAWSTPSAEAAQRVTALLAELDLAAQATRPVNQLSGGERRRVWLARALVQAPRLLVLDEPTAFLDVKHQLESLALVRRRVAEGLGVLAVLHDVNLARAFATHALLLQQGRVLAAGPVDAVLTTANLSALYGVRMQEVATAQGPLFFPGAPA